MNIYPKQDVEAIISFALAHIKEAVFLIDEYFHFVYVNDEACRVLEYTREELLNRKISDVDPDFSKEKGSGHWQELKNTRSMIFEGRHMTKNGRIFPVEISANYIEYGSKSYNFAIVRNITQRKQAEKKLAASEERLRLAMDAAKIGIWDWDVINDRYYASPVYYTMLGYEPKGNLANREEWIPRLHPDDRQKVLDKVNSILAGTCSNYFYEARFLHADGSYRWQYAMGYGAQVDADGKASRMLGLRIDIDERKQAEHQVALMNFALNNVHESAVMLDENARILYVNNEACRILGYTRDELLKMSLMEVVPRFSPDRWTRHWKDLKELGSFTFEDELKTFKGQVFPVEINANFFEYDGYSYDLGLIRDITERKQIERERINRVNFFESMDKINRAIQAASDLDQMMICVLDTVLDIFDCDKIQIIFPCNPEAASWAVEMERTKDGYRSITALGEKIPMTPEVAKMHRLSRSSGTPILFGAGSNLPLTAAQIKVGDQSGVGMAVYPKASDVWGFSMVQCSHPRIWTSEEIRLFESIGRRLADGLSNLLTYRELYKNKEFLENIVEHIPNMVFVKDARTFKYVRFNKAGEKLLGYPREKLLGRTDLDLFPEATANFFMSKDQQVLDRKELENIPEETIINQKGQKRVLNTKKIPILDQTGMPQYLLGISEDITERKQSEAFIRKLSQAIEQSPVSIVITDRNGKIEFVNRKFTQITGYSFSEAAGQNPRILKSGETKASEYRQLWKTILSGDVWRGEFHNRKKNGELFWEQATIAPVRNSDNRITHFVAVKEDITERKRAEEIIREKQKFIRNILDSVDEGFIVIDKQYRIRSANRAFCKMFEVAESNAIDRLCHEITHKRIRPCYEFGEDCAVRQTFITGKGHLTMHTHENENGLKQHIELKTYPVTDGSGEVVSVIETFNDVTEKRKLEQQLMQAQKMESVGRLAGGIAHDFNNMLGVIIGHSEMSLDAIEEDSLFFDSFNEILNAAKRSGDLTRQLLAFARQQVISPKVLDLNETVGGMTKMLGRLIGEDIALTWNPGKNIWPVKMDPAQIDQILVNLCVNARDAISGVGTVSIEMENATFDDDYCAAHPETCKGDYLNISISDDGRGMDNATLEKIFDPFFTTKEMGKGTGLGLAMVYGIVKQNGGFIYVYSEPGCGSIFRIYLPRYIAKEKVSENGDTSRSLIRGHETILLVEDNPAFLNMTRLMLESLGYQVYIAATPGEAIRIVDTCENEIHLLLTDVVMPEMSGRELANQLHRRRPSIRHLFMSGYTGDFIAHRGVLDEGIQFIQKPFSVQDLSVKISEILRNDRDTQL